MKTIGIALMVLVFGTAVLGFYRGWFTLSSQSGGTESNKVNINLTVDPDKAKVDAEKLKNQTKELRGKVTEEAKSARDLKRDKVESHEK